MKGDALKGHLDLLILSVLAEGPQHGYSVIEALRDRSEQAFDLPEGTVYPVLHRLEQAGHLVSEWSVVGGRRRRTYRITPSGGTPSGRAADGGAVADSSAVGHVLGRGVDGDLIVAYLTELGQGLPEWQEADDVLAEIEDHLRQKASRLEAAGLGPEAAQREALEAFGDPIVVARAFTTLPTVPGAVPPGSPGSAAPSESLQAWPGSP